MACGSFHYSIQKPIKHNNPESNANTSPSPHVSHKRYLPTNRFAVIRPLCVLFIFFSFVLLHLPIFTNISILFNPQSNIKQFSFLIKYYQWDNREDLLHQLELLNHGMMLPQRLQFHSLFRYHKT